VLKEIFPDFILLTFMKVCYILNAFVVKTEHPLRTLKWRRLRRVSVHIRTQESQT